MYYTFYKITNLINQKFYYGVHQTEDLNDEYLGSGRAICNAVKKYGKENFKKEILKFFNSREEMFAYEHDFVTEDLVRNSMCYNMNIGGYGGTLPGELNKLTGRSFTKEHCDRISKSLKGKPKSAAHRAKQSESMKGHTSWNKDKKGCYSQEILDRISKGTSIGLQKYFLTHSRDPQQYKKCWDTRRKNGTTHTRNGQKNSEHQKEVLRNTKWMCNGIDKPIRVNINDIEDYKNKGYILGRKFK